MADTNLSIAVVAKNEASATLRQVSADFANLASAAQTTNAAFAAVGNIAGSLNAAGAQVASLTGELKFLAAEATKAGGAVANATGKADTTGAEQVRLAAEQIRGQLTSLRTDAQRLAGAGLFGDPAQTVSAVATIDVAVAKLSADLGILTNAASRAANVGVLGEGNTNTQAALNNISATVARVRQELTTVQAQTNAVGGVNIPIKATNEASPAIAQVGSSLATMQQQAASAVSVLREVNVTLTGLAQARTEISNVSTELARLTNEAKISGTAVNAATKTGGAGGVESIAAATKLLRSELVALEAEASKMARAGLFGDAAQSAAALGQIGKSVATAKNDLKQLEQASVNAEKAGVLGNGARASSQLGTVTTSVRGLQSQLRQLEQAAKQADQRVSTIGRGTAGGLATLKAELSSVNNAIGGLGGALAGGIGGIAGFLGVGAAVGAISQISGAINSAVTDAARLTKVRQSFDQLAESAGNSGDEMLASMRRASYGMVSDTELILSANKAMLLGAARNAEDMAALLNIARVRGQAMGLDLGAAFDQITTGIGRMSPRILDNLGIVVDADIAFLSYAQSIGKASEKLTEAEKRIALLNAVIEQSKGLTASAPSGPAASIAQSEVAQQEARLALGGLFAPVTREWADAQTDFVRQSLGQWDEYAARVRDVTQVAADFGGDDRNAPQQVQRWAELAQAMAQVQDAIIAGVPEAEQYAAALDEIAQKALLTRNIDQQTANTVALAADGIKAEAEAYAALRASLDQLDPKLDNNRQKQEAVATAEEQAAAAATLAKYTVDALAGSMYGANAAAQAMAGGLSQVQAMAGATVGIIYNLRDANIELQRVSNANLAKPNAYAQIVPQINQIGTGLVDNLGLPGAIDKADELKRQFKDQYDTLKALGYTEDQITLAMQAQVSETQKWAAGLDDVGQEAEAAKRQFEDIKSAISGIVKEQLKVEPFKASDLYSPDQLAGLGLSPDAQVSVDQAANGGRRPDAINENARRLAAIAKEGIADQPWLEEFKREVPRIFDEVAQSADPRGTALKMLQEFEAGMRPELLDRDAIKQRVKTMLLGDANVNAYIQEIAAELSAELGVSMETALASTNAALGLPTAAAGGNGANGESAGLTAGQSFTTGFEQGIDATRIVTKLSNDLKLPDNLQLIYTAGTTAGSNWGQGFMATVGNNIPAMLIGVLVNVVTPGVWAQIQARQSQTGAQP